MRSLGFNPTANEVENMCMKVDYDGKSINSIVVALFPIIINTRYLYCPTPYTYFSQRYRRKEHQVKKDTLIANES